MRLAISGEGLGSVMSLPEILKVYRNVGVRAIELWPENAPVLPGKSLIHKRLYENRDIWQAKELLEKAGVEVACVAFGAAFDKALAEDVALYARQLALAVEAAHILGAKLVNHYCYHLCMEGSFDLFKARRYYAPALELAKEYGVTLVLENEAHDATRDPRQMLALVQAMNSPCFCTNYDATNYYQAGFEAYPMAYNLLRPVIAHIHIKNGCIYDPAQGHNPLCKGEYATGSLEGHAIYYPTADDGAVNIEGILRRLLRDGYDGFCTLEPHTTPELCLEYYEKETAYLYGTGFFCPE